MTADSVAMPRPRPGYRWACHRDDLEGVLHRAHAYLDQFTWRYVGRHELRRNSALSWEEWRALPGRRSPIDGRPI